MEVGAIQITRTKRGFQSKVAGGKRHYLFCVPTRRRRLAARKGVAQAAGGGTVIDG
jgi:hypothetical protein